MRYTLIAVIFSSLLITSEGIRAEGNYSYSFGFGYSNNTGHGSRHGYGGAHGYGHGGKRATRYGYQHGAGHQFGYGNRYGHGNRNGHKPGHGIRRGNFHNYRNNPGSSFGYSYRYHGGHHNSGEIAGAFLLGGVIGYGVSNVHQRQSYYTQYNNYYRDPYLNSRDIVYPGSRREPVSTPSSSRRLYKDRNGNCSEIVHNSFGDELRIQLDRFECNW